MANSSEIRNTENRTPIHIGYNRETGEAPTLAPFSFPPALRTYLDEHIGEPGTTNTERHIIKVLRGSGIVKVATILGEPGNTRAATVFTLDVSESVAKISATASALRSFTCDGYGGTPKEQPLAGALKAFEESGTPVVHCLTVPPFPSRTSLPTLAARLSSAREALGLPDDAPVIFEWNGEIIRAKASDTCSDLYNKIYSR